MKTWTFAQLVDAGLMKVGDGYRAKNIELGGDGLVFLRSAYLQDAGFILSDPDRFQTSLPQKFGDKVAQLGDSVITTKGNSTGRVGYVNGNVEGSVYSPHLSYWRSMDRGHLEPRFLYYWSRSAEFLDQLGGMAFATDMAPYLSLRDQLRLEIRLPEIEVQTEIAATLGALDDKIELNRRVSATLEEMARALYRSWFVDFDPVHARALGQPPAHMDPTTAALFPDSFAPDGLPKGWGIVELGQYCVQAKTTVKPMQQVEQLFQHFSLPAFDTGQEAPFETGASIKSNKVLVPENAILFSRLNPRIPRVWWAKTSPDQAIPVCSTEFFVAQARTFAAVPHLYCLLSSGEFLEAALARVGGTSGSHQRVSPDSLKGIESVSPPIVVIEAFGETTFDWFNKIHLMTKENATLAALRDTLLPRLMSGELRIREAEKQIEEVV